MNTQTTQAMVSRSLRLKKDTLTVLEEQAKELDLGITVLIRRILENHVHSLTTVRENTNA